MTIIQQAIQGDEQKQLCVQLRALSLHPENPRLAPVREHVISLNRFLYTSL